MVINSVDKESKFIASRCVFTSSSSSSTITPPPIQQQQQIQPIAKPFQMYKHDDLDGQGDHSNPTQFYYKHLVSGLDPALCTSGGSWSSLHSLVSLTRCYRQYRYSKERERETPSCTGDFNAPPFDDLVEPVNCTWIPYHGRDLFL